MNELVRQFLQEDAHYESVLILNEQSLKNWGEVEKKAPNLPRGWFELSQLSTEDRVGFTRDFWLNRLPFHPIAHTAINNFFYSLDDVGVVLSKSGTLWTPQLIYSLSDNSCFFRGLIPATNDDLEELKEELDFAFPSDFSSFMKIHNGFGKLSELELLTIEEIPDAKRHVMQMILTSERPVKSGETFVDAGSLVPFYEAIGLSSFQCFYADWYATSEMGNVYFSGIDYTLSNTSQREAWNENGAFATFLEWLAAYLEGMNIAP